MGIPRPALIATAALAGALLLAPPPATAVPGAPGRDGPHPVREGGGRDTEVAKTPLSAAVNALRTGTGTTPGSRRAAAIRGVPSSTCRP